MLFPEFKTDRLNLTQITNNDADAIYELFSDQKVVEYYDFEAFTEHSQSSQFIRRMQERFEFMFGIRWAIRFKGSDNLIGTCGFNSWNINMKSTVIGYDLHPTFWGEGIMTEAIHRIAVEAFYGELPCGTLNRIQANTVPGNAASESVLLKVGFKEEGLRRQSGYWKNRFHDLKCFGLIKDEFKKDKKL